MSASASRQPEHARLRIAGLRARRDRAALRGSRSRASRGPSRCAAFLSRPAARPTRFGNSIPIAVTGDGGSARRERLRDAEARRARRGPRTPCRAPSRGRARTGTGGRTDRACACDARRATYGDIRRCASCAMIPFARSLPSACRPCHRRSSVAALAVAAARLRAPRARDAQPRRAADAAADAAAPATRSAPTCAHSSTNGRAEPGFDRARRRALVRRGALSSRRSSRRWTGRCSSRRSGTSTRRRSWRRSASTAASRSGARNADALERAEAEYGVPAGDHRRDHRRRDVSTAATSAVVSRDRRARDARVRLPAPRAVLPRRAASEFLLLAREQGFSPLAPKGSFAGAMGVPQFMPGSYRRFAVDFDGDGRVDLWREHRRRDRQRRELPRAPRLAARPAGAAARGDRAGGARRARCGDSTAASASGARCGVERRRRHAATLPADLPPIRSGCCCSRRAPEGGDARELLDRVSQLLRDHALQPEPALRGRGVGARAERLRNATMNGSAPHMVAGPDLTSAGEHRERR